jgi:pimeloyl-ACP methyl ester carboxylesterase
MRRLLLALTLAIMAAPPVAAATVDGIPIHFTTTGSGPATLIFVHGWTCDETSWAAQVPALARRYRVVTLDLPGHGRSGAPADGKFSMDLFARAVESVRQESKADRVVLIGHSMGAPVIRQYARRYPQHVAALVAVDGPLDMTQFGTNGQAFTPPPMTGEQGRQFREKMIRSMFTPNTPPPLQQQIMTMMLNAPEATASGAMAAMFDPANRTADVATVPALAVYAGTAQMPNVTQTRRVLPNFDAVQMAGTGHFLMMEQPDEFNRTLSGFLDRVGF